MFENGCKFAIRMASQMAVLCTRVRERSKICHPDAHPDGRTLHTCSGTAPNSQRGLPPESRKHLKRSVSVWYKCSQISTDCLKDDRPVSGRFCLQEGYIGTSTASPSPPTPTRFPHSHLPPWSVIQSIKFNVANLCLYQLVGKQPTKRLSTYITF